MEAFNTQLLRFFDWLLWASLQGTVLIILIVLIQKILRRRLPVRWHYLLWLLLLIRLAVPWLPESKLSIFNLVPRSVQQGRIIETFSEPKSTRGMGFYFSAESVDTQEPENNSEAISVRFARMLPLLWLLGTVVIASYVCMRSIGLWRTVKRERPITDQEILDLLEDCKMQMGVETIIGVVVSDRIKSPALFGFIRPRLLLPQGILETYGFEELRYVFIHELAHLKQRDIYFGWLIALLQVVHWFNPLMWFAFGRMRADREIACDRLAISTMEPDEPPKYGRTIVSLLESFSQVRYLPSVAGILEDTCQIERRIKMIADYKKTPRPRWAGAMLLLAVLACVVLTNAYVAKADYEFGTPTNLGTTINGPDDMLGVCISYDGLELYFCSNRPGGYGGYDLWMATRPTIYDDWSAPMNLGLTVNSQYTYMAPSISADGLTLYFSDYDYSPPSLPGGFGATDTWMLTRETKDAAWSAPVNVGRPVNFSGGDISPNISADGLSLYLACGVSRGGPGWYDLWFATRATTDDEWGNPKELGPSVNSGVIDVCPSVSSNDLVLFFCSDRANGQGDYDIWLTSRATKEHDWCPSVNLGPVVNSSAIDGFPSISADGSTLYFCSNRSGGFGERDIYQVQIESVVDFNGDGNINTDDLLILIDYWGQNDPLCDIGPTPLGDGIVDIKNLEVFMIYWEQENIPEIPEEEL